MAEESQHPALDRILNMVKEQYGRDPEFAEGVKEIVAKSEQ